MTGIEGTHDKPHPSTHIDEPSPKPHPSPHIDAPSPSTPEVAIVHYNKTDKPKAKVGLLSVKDGWKWVEKNANPKQRDHTKMFCRLYCDKCSVDGRFGVMVANESLVHRYTATQDWFDQGFVEGFIALVQHDAHIQKAGYKT